MEDAGGLSRDAGFWLDLLDLALGWEIRVIGGKVGIARDCVGSEEELN